MEEILIPLALFAMVLGIVAVSVWGNVQNKKELNETVRRAIDAGHKLDADTISSLGKPVKTAAADLRGGLVLLFLGAGLIAAGLMASGVILGNGWDDDAGIGFFVAASIVSAIGVGQLVAGLVRRSDKKTET
jgi:Domain of unknown function (DUF6249)